jgi:mannose PTS system EIIA component
MIGLVIVTHGRLADEFILAVQHVVGKQEQIASVCIGPDDKLDSRRKDISTAVAAVDTGEGVIILTDMFGGTPSNLAISLLEENKIEVVAGLNLPMLVKLCRVRPDCTLNKAAFAAQDAGRKYIHVASQVLGD